MVIAVLTKVRGILQTVADESLTLLIDPFEIEVLIPEHTRRQVQSRGASRSRCTPSSI